MAKLERCEKAGTATLDVAVEGTRACLSSSSCKTGVAAVLIGAGAATANPALAGVGIGIITATDAVDCVNGSGRACAFLALDALTVGSGAAASRGLWYPSILPRAKSLTPLAAMLQRPSAATAQLAFGLVIGATCVGSAGIGCTVEVAVGRQLLSFSFLPATQPLWGRLVELGKKRRGLE